MALPPDRELIATKIALHELLVAYEELAGALLRVDPGGGPAILHELEKGVAARLTRIKAETPLGTGGLDILADAAGKIRAALLNARNPGSAKSGSH